MTDVVLAVDAGTTGVRTVAVGPDCVSRAFAYREFPQHFPRPGWVEHDPDDIWHAVQETLGEVVASLDGDTVVTGLYSIGAASVTVSWALVGVPETEPDAVTEVAPSVASPGTGMLSVTSPF